MSSQKWYEAGLKFECAQCGNCCTGSQGYVWITAEERTKIAEYLQMNVEKFIKTYARRVGFKYSLRERGGEDNWDCIFLASEKGKRSCRIYPVRPRQCRAWPFWSENLKARSAWDAAAGNCSGMNHGKHYDFVQIEIERSRRS